MPVVKSLDHLVLTVRDIAQSIAFYENALGMVSQRFVADDGSERVALTFGRQKINLHQAGAEFEPKANGAAPGTADLCFLGDVSIATWGDHFSAIGVKILEGPVRRSGATGPIRSLYLRDPDGNLIEVSETL